MPEWIGQTIGKVRIEKFLARGGMAEIYLGTHLTLDRPVAVKVMLSYIEEDADLHSRFQREAKVVAALRHPNIVQIFDFDVVDGHPYIVMEYLKGPSLSAYLKYLHQRNARIPVQQVARLVKSLASALDYAHGEGVIHRDIKPGNILLHSKTNQVPPEGKLTNSVDAVLTDFGLVRIVHSATQTASGLVSGTPAYMSPEQARGDRVDYRTDIYSLGVVLYEMLAGRVPFDGDSTMAVIYKHIHEPPPPIEGAPSALQAVMDRALAKDPNLRYQSALAMTVDLLRAIGLNTDAQTIMTNQVQAPRPAPPPKKRKSASSLPWIIGGLLACGCIGALALGGLGLSAISIFPGLNSAATMPPVTEAPIVEPASPMPMPMEGASLGVLRFQDGASKLDQITVSANLGTPAAGSQYEAWLISDSGEQRRSLGILTQNASGQFILTFVDPESRNLLDGFSHMEITVEPSPDDSPNPSDQVAYSSAVPPSALMHIRHLLVGIDETPNHIGMADGLVNTSSQIKTSADAMQGAFNSGDLGQTRANAEAIINLIVGKQDANFYKDWDNDGTLNDPGDGYGLLLNGDQAGYVGGVIDHAELSAKSPDATEEIRIHSEHVTVCAQNIETWATQLRDAAVRIVQADAAQDIGPDVHTASALANQILDGIDIDGNETVDPISGEGGALTAYEHADYMSDMPILAGKDQIPPAGN